MTLTQTAILVKQIITISVIALVLGTASFIGFRIWVAYQLANLPPVEEKPDSKFGLLPQLNFPKGSVSTSNFSYSLETTTGGLPKVGIDLGFEKIIKVYFLTQTFATLLAPERSSALAEKFGINTAPDILSETKYKFKDAEKSLLVDLDNGNFLYNKEATVSAVINPDNADKIISDFKQILSNLGVLKDDLKVGRGKVTLLKIAEGKLIPTQLPSETLAYSVSLWPAQIDKRQIFTADFDKSLVTATVFGSADRLDNYLSLNFTYYPIDTSTFATYPIKTSEQAFDDLKTGKGVVIVEPQKPQVSITSVSMGYYLSENYSPYLQPIFIFEGPNFVAYVAAINEQFTSSTTQN